MPLSYEQNFSVYHYECDPWARMTPGAVLRRVQQISTDHCTTLGINNELYKHTKTVFLLAKVSIHIWQMPTAEDTVRAQTHAYGMRRAVMNRLTTLYSEAGEKLCEVDSRWILVNTETWRIVRRLPAGFEVFGIDEALAQEHDMGMPKSDALQECARLTAGYSLCDANHHVNNTRYADIVCDHLPIELLQNSLPKRMVLSYHSEIPMAEQFELYTQALSKNEFYFSARQAGTKNFEAFVTF